LIASLSVCPWAAKFAQIRHRLLDHEFGQRLIDRRAARGQEIRRRDHAELGMPCPQQRLGAAHRHGLEIDLGLVPERSQLLRSASAGSILACLASFGSGAGGGAAARRLPAGIEAAPDIGAAKRLLDRRQHGQAVPLAMRWISPSVAWSRPLISNTLPG